ncbi:transporter protein amiS2 [Mycobacteroides abscessus subsp. abscessus]|nr:transporter protein amiS2 [Mycobacteroides abscessus subsp. abscessus]
MGAVGLLYVGAVLLVNGLMLLEVVPARSAAILNLFVGALQCVLPTALLIQAAGDPAAVLAASGLYLFGFTYLYVGIGTSGFVAVAALVYAAVAFTHTDDPVSGVIWLAWAVLWSLFFLVLALGREQLTRVTGWALILLSQPTCSLPAFLMLTGNFHPTAGLALVWAAGLAAALALAWLLGSPSRTHRAPQPAYH